MIFILWGYFFLTNKQTFLGPLGFSIWTLLLILTFLSILLNATSVYGKNGDFCFLEEFVFWVMGWCILWEQSRRIGKKEVVSFFFSSVCFELIFVDLVLSFVQVISLPTANRSHVCFWGKVARLSISVFELLILFFFLFFFVFYFRVSSSMTWIYSMNYFIR